jgi:predicted kinase
LIVRQSKKEHKETMHPHADSKTILVSGPPGSGKTTPALDLAAELGFALISKDHIKETLFDTMDGVPGDLASSRKFGAAAMELLWILARHSPQVILEANFRYRSEYERNRVREIKGTVVEVYCDCPVAEVQRRFEERARSPEYHLTHTFASITREYIEEFGRPLGIGTVVRADTSKPVDIAALGVEVSNMWNA